MEIFTDKIASRIVIDNVKGEVIKAYDDAIKQGFIDGEVRAVIYGTAMEPMRSLCEYWINEYIKGKEDGKV